MKCIDGIEQIIHWFESEYENIAKAEILNPKSFK